MVERLDADFFGNGFIGQHQIEFVQAQLGDEFWKFSFLAGHVHLFRHAQGGFQKVIGHGLRDRVCNPYAKFQRFGVAAGEADRFFQLVPQRKNLLRVTQGDTTLAGEFQPTPPLAKEVVAQPFLQLFDLPRKRLGRGVQLLACPHHPSGLCNRPEIPQMLEVHGDKYFVKNDQSTLIKRIYAKY